MTAPFQTDDAGLLEERDRALEVDRRELDTAIRAVLDTPNGRLVWLWIRDLCFQEEADAPADPLEVQAWRGRRQIGVVLDKTVAPFADLARMLDIDWTKRREQRREYGDIMRRLHQARASR